MLLDQFLNLLSVHDHVWLSTSVDHLNLILLITQVRQLVLLFLYLEAGRDIGVVPHLDLLNLLRSVVEDWILQQTVCNRTGLGQLLMRIILNHLSQLV